MQIYSAAREAVVQEKVLTSSGWGPGDLEGEGQAERAVELIARSIR